MNILKIPGATRTIGETQGYLGLPLRDSFYGSLGIVFWFEDESIKQIGPLVGQSRDMRAGKLAMRSWFLEAISKANVIIRPTIRDGVKEDSVTGPNTPVMETLWEPTPEERKAIAEGANIVLMVAGQQHPPVMLSVGDGA